VEAAQVLGARARTDARVVPALMRALRREGNIAEEIAVDFAASLAEGNSRL
jgi:hypothetical protein